MFEMKRQNEWKSKQLFCLRICHIFNNIPKSAKKESAHEDVVHYFVLQVEHKVTKKPSL